MDNEVKIIFGTGNKRMNFARLNYHYFLWLGVILSAQRRTLPPSGSHLVTPQTVPTSLWSAGVDVGQMLRQVLDRPPY